MGLYDDINTNRPDFTTQRRKDREAEIMIEIEATAKELADKIMEEARQKTPVLSDAAPRQERRLYLRDNEGKAVIAVVKLMCELLPEVVLFEGYYYLQKTPQLNDGQYYRARNVLESVTYASVTYPQTSQLFHDQFNSKPFRFTQEVHHNED